MKITKGTYTRNTFEEYGTQFVGFTVAMAVLSHGYTKIVTTQIKAQFDKNGRYYFAPSIETRLGMDWQTDEEKEFAEAWLVKNYKSYIERSNNKALDIGASLSKDQYLHLTNFLEKKKFKRYPSWMPALEKIREFIDSENKM